MEAETFSSTLGFGEPEAPVDTLADTGRGGGRVCWQDKQVDPIRQL